MNGNVLRRWISKATNRGGGARATLRRRARAFESLEPRVLLTTTDYILDGSNLTTIVDGVSSTSAVANVNNVQITGDGTLNHIIVQNFSGHVTINGGGGGDQITVYGGGGGTVTVHDTAPSPADQLVVRAPIAVVANITVGPSVITVGSDTINYDNTVSSVSVVGQLFTTGDTLTVNGSASAETIAIGPATIQVGTNPTIYYSTFTSLTVNGGGGDDTFNVNGNYIPTSLTAGAGDATFNVNTNSVSLAITGGSSGTDTYNINSNAGPLTITGQGADNMFVVNASAANVTLNGGTAGNTYTVNSNSANLTINGGAVTNSVTVAANAGTITVNGGTGTDTFAVQTTSGMVTLKGGAGANTTYDIAAPTIGPVKVIGNTGTGALTFHGTTLHDVFAVTATTLSAGTGATVTYSNLTQVIVDGVEGDDTFLVTSAGTPTTLMGQTGNNTFNVRADTALVTIDSGSGTNTINVGSNAPGATGNVLGNVVGGVNVIGSGTDVLNLNDGGNTTATVATLSTAGLTGIGGGITYSGLAALNVKMGSGGNTLNVTGSPATLATGVNLGSGVNTALVTSTAPTAGGVTDDVLGTLTLTGSGADDLVVDDSGNATPKTGTLSATAISGMSPAVINYAGFATLAVKLGSGGNDFTVNNTNATTPTTVNGGAGDDTIRILANASAMSVTTGGGADVIAVRSIGAATTVTSAGGASIVVGTMAPAAGGLLSGIQAALTVAGGGGDTLTLDNTGASGVTATGALSATALTGFGMAVTGVAYSNIGTLNVNLGDGGNDLTVSDTAGVTTTNVNGGAGVDVVTVQLVSGATNVAMGGGADVVNVRAVNAATTVDTGAGADVVNVGSSATLGAGVIDGIAASLSVQGNTTAVLNVDDGGNGVGKTGALSSTTVTGISAGTITYAGIAALNLMLGTADDVLAIASTGTATSVNTGGGADTVTVMTTAHAVTLSTGLGDDQVDVRTTGAALSVDTGTGDNTILAGSNGILGGGTLGGIVGALDVTGGGTNVFSLDDGGNASGTTATLTASSLTGLNPGGITFHGITTFSLVLGSGDDTFNIDHTIAGTTTVASGDGDDTFNVHGTDGDTTLTPGAGTNTVNVSSLAPAAGGATNAIAGALHVVGGGLDVMNIDDGGSSAAKTVTMTSTSVTGLSPAAIGFVGLASLAVKLGSGGNTVTIASTAVGTATSVTTGAGVNTINVRSTDSATTLNLGPAGNTVNVGSLAPAANSTLDLINGAITIHGGGLDEVNLDDSGNSVAKTVAISATAVTGASPQAVAFDNLGALRLRLGSGNDVATVLDSSAYLTLNTGAGADQVNVRKTTKDITVQTGAGVGDTVKVGSLAPAAGGALANIYGVVTVVGNGLDTLDVDDSGNSAASVGGLTGTTLSGLSPAAITYSGLAQMLVHLGTGGDTFNISGAAGTAYTVTTGGGTNTVNVGAISGLTTSTGGMVGPVTVTGSGSDVLNVSDVGASGARTGSLTATQVLLGNANVSYTGLAAVNLTLAASTTFSVASTAGGVNNSISGSGGTVTVGSAGYLTSGVAGPVSISGGNVTDVVVDDSGDGTGRTVTVTSSTVTGLSPAAISYAGAKTLVVRTGSGGDVVTVDSTHARPTSIETNGGDDQVNVRTGTGSLSVATGAGTNTVVIGSNAPATAGGLTAPVVGAVEVNGAGGAAAVVIDDSGDTAAKTVGITSNSVSGLNDGEVRYLAVTSVSVRLGSGDDTVLVVGTGAAVSVDGGDGVDSVTVTGPGLGGRLTLDGAGGADALVVNGGGSGEVGLTATAITGLPQQVDYASFATLRLNLAVTQSLAINEMNPATVTTVSNPSGQGSATFAGDFDGQLSVSEFFAGTISVGGAFNATLTLAGGLQGLSVGGDFNGDLTLGGDLQDLGIGGDLNSTISVGGEAGSVSIGGDVAGSLAITGGAGTLSVGGDLKTTVSVGGDVGTASIGGGLAGTFTVGGDLGSLEVGGDVSGTLTVGGGDDMVTVEGDLTATGSVDVTGTLGWMTVAGRDAGSISAGAVGFIGVGAAVPASGTGVLFSVTQAGVKRTVRAIVSEGVAATGVTAAVGYDGAAGSVPQAAILLSNANAGNRFDLLLDAPANSSGFDLTRVKSADGAYVGVRNVDVAGNVLNNGITTSQATYFNAFGDRTGGVDLPAENLAAVAAMGNLALWSIRAKSVQAIAFATVTQKSGTVWKASAVADSQKWQDEILIGSLAIDPATNRPYAKVNKPTETLRILAGTSRPVGLFVGKNTKYFAGHPSYFGDQHVDAEPPVAVEVTFLGKWRAQVPAIGTLAFIGDGGSVDTDELVVNITSTGPLGDVTLRAGRPEILQTLSAPSMFGQLRLFKGASIAKAARNGLAAAQAAHKAATGADPKPTITAKSEKAAAKAEAAAKKAAAKAEAKAKAAAAKAAKKAKLAAAKAAKQAEMAAKKAAAKGN